MSSPFLPQLALGIGIIVSVTQSAVSQQLDSLSVGIHAQATLATAPPPEDAPSILFLGAKSVAWASAGAMTAGAVGFGIDSEYCQKHHGDEPVIFFGPCFMPAGGATAVGWFGGSVIGATIGAARIARKRGCPSRAATMRALAGAALGALPGLSIVARRPGKYPPAHTALVFGTPLLAGVGAAASVAGCRG